jgi:hypothetical protein
MASQHLFLKNDSGVEMFIEYFLGASVAFAAASGHAQIAPQFGHRTHAQVDGQSDFTVGYVVTNTDNHHGAFTLGDMNMRTTCELHAKPAQSRKQPLKTVLPCNLMRIIIIAFQFSRNRAAFASDIDQASAGTISVVSITLFDANRK